MKKNIWVLINYHNCQEIHQLVKKYCDQASMIIVDNSGDYFQIKEEKVLKPEYNLGYIGGFQYAIGTISGTNNKIILSNSDIEILNLSTLFEISTNKKPRIIVPSVINLDGNYQNPHLIYRPSKKFYQMRKFFSSNQYLWTLWTIASKIKFRKSKNSAVDKFKIYAGHGSFLIFENIDLTPLQKENYNFLFGEEIHFAEMALSSNIPIEFNKSIEVKHFEHASTNSIKDRVKVEFFHQSYSEILKRYYP